MVLGRFNLNQCLKKEIEKEQMNNILYTSIVERLMDLRFALDLTSLFLWECQEDIKVIQVWITKKLQKSDEIFSRYQKLHAYI